MQNKVNLIIILLILSTIAIGINCKALKNIFSSDDEEWDKWARNVEIIYERTLPYESTDYFDAHVDLNIDRVAHIEGWVGVSNETMEKVNERRFELIVDRIPAEKTLYAWVSDFGKDMPWPQKSFCRQKDYNKWNRSNGYSQGSGKQFVGCSIF